MSYASLSSAGSSSERLALAEQVEASRLALAVALLAALTLAGAWAFQLAGYPPCELCLVQRYPYDAGVPLALVTALLLAVGSRWIGGAGLVLLVVLFLGSAVLGGYHAGVEWQLWAGPSGCTGAIPAPAAVGDFLKQLGSVKVVRCDAAALRVLGLSLAGWNAVISLVLALIAARGLAALGSRRWG